MSIIRRNIVANLAGRGWSALLSVAVIPLYIRFIGIEAYGLIGFFLSLMSILSLLDLGLGTALNREFANCSAKSGNEQRMHDLLCTLERAYWLIGIAIAIAMAAVAPLIVAYWISPQQLAGETVIEALILMSISVAFQWPRALYSGGMMGLQKQVSLNVLLCTTGTINSVGGVFVLWFVSPTIHALIIWSMLVSIADIIITRLMLLRSLSPAPLRPSFSRALLKDIWRFAAGMTGVTILSVILSQLDKVILAKVLTLEAFGYYNIAWRVASGLFSLINPVSAAFFPRYSQLLLLNEKEELARLYHRGCQLMSVVVLPIAVVLVFYSGEFLLLWTQDVAVATNSGTMLALLCAGTAVSGLVNMPFTLQLASGQTRLLFYTLATAVILATPFTYFFTLWNGGVGAAWVFIMLNCAYILFYLPIMHRLFLPGHLRKWFVMDVGMPLLGAVMAALLCRLATGSLGSQVEMLFSLILASLLVPLAAAMSAPLVRKILFRGIAHRAQSWSGKK